MNDSFALFKAKLDRFRKKYYQHLILEGFIWCLLIVFAIVFLFSVTEFVFCFSTQIRFIFLLSIIFLSFLSAILLVLIPFLQLIYLLSGKSDLEFCKLIQSKIPETKDILVNIFELNKLNNSDLIAKSISQKFDIIRNIDFNNIITFNFLRIRKISVILLIEVLFLLFFSRFLFSGFNRIIHYSDEFNLSEQVTLFIDESKLSIEQGSNLTVNALLHNNRTSDVFISVNGNHYIMNSDNDSLFNFTFKNVNNSFKFNIICDEYVSKNFLVNVYDSPIITYYKTNIYYPKYVNKLDSVVENQNIIIVPQGTFLKYDFTASCDSFFIFSSLDSTLIKSFEVLNNSVEFDFPVSSNFCFYTVVSNKFVKRKSIEFKIVSIEDSYPEIEIINIDTVTNDNTINFSGRISDDYGFTSLCFIKRTDNKIDTSLIPIYTNISSQQFYYSYSFDSKLSFDEQNHNLWFEVFDNDAVNGPKKTQSNILNYTINDIINQMEDKQHRYDELFQKFIEAQKLSDDIKNDIEHLRKKSLDSKLSDWEKNDMLKQISDKSEQLNELIEELNQNFNQTTNSLSAEKNEELIKKQQLISEMLNSLIDDELKQMLQEMQNLLNNQNQTNLTPEQLKQEFENFEKSINKQYELIKKMKIEDNLHNISNSFNLLSEQQKALQSIPDSILKQEILRQEDIFNSLEDEYENILNENKELSRPFELNDLSEEFENIQNEFNKQNNAIDSSNYKSIQKSSENNSQNLKQLASSIEQKLEKSNMESEAENAEDLRQILDNLFAVSFELENIYKSMSDNKVYQDVILLQTKLLDNFKIVRDSLYSLSLRTPYLNNQISKASFLIEDNIISSLKNMQEQNSYRARKNQRDAMTQSNEMILLISESLKNINDAASGSSGNSRSKKKKKQSELKQSLSDMRKMQEDMKNQMKDLLNQMKSGDGKNINQNLAKSLMQNEIYQQMLEQMMYNQDIDSKTAKLLQEIRKMMEANHKDFAKKQLSAQTMLRQQRIVTKLLEAENSENEREKEERRESTIAKNINRKSPDNLPEEIKFDKNIDLLNRTNIRLNSFYKVRYEKYINQLNTKADE